MLHWFLSRADRFGDLLIALVVAVVAGLWLCRHGERRAAALWSAAVAGCIVSMGLLKLGFQTGDLSLPGAALDNPSGHTAISTTVYGGVAWIAAAYLRDWRRPAVLLLAGAAVAAIAASLVYIDAHTPAEIAVGFVVGAVWLGLFATGARRSVRKRAGSPLLLLLAVAAIALLGYATHWSASAVAAMLPLPKGFAGRL